MNDSLIACQLLVQCVQQYAAVPFHNLSLCECIWAGLGAGVGGDGRHLSTWRRHLVVPAVGHPLFSTATAGLDSATPGGQRFHTWIGAVSEPCRAWARCSARSTTETFSPAAASPAGTTYET